MTISRLLLAALVLVTAGGCASVAPGSAPTSTLERIKATKTIALGYRTSSIPFSSMGPDNKPIGYSIDLCTRVVDDIRRTLSLPDLQIRWVPVTIQTRIGAVMDGSVDLECGSTTNTLSRQEQVDFSLTTFVDGASLLGLAEARPDAELRGIRIAIVPGSTTERAVKDSLAAGGSGVGATYIPVKDHADGLAALEGRTADVYASDRVILIGLATTARDPSRFALLDRYLSYEPYGLMLRRGDPAFRLAVNRVLARLYRSGDIREIYRRWFAQWGLPGELLLAMYAIEGLPE